MKLEDFVPGALILEITMEDEAIPTFLVSVVWVEGRRPRMARCSVLSRDGVEDLEYGERYIETLRKLA